MLLRGRSKDRTSRKVTPPGPAYMSNDQFANYLADLRNNRVARPTGARPLPSSTTSRRDTDQGISKSQMQSASTRTSDEIPHSSEALPSHKRAQSAFSSMSSRYGRSIVQQPYGSVSMRDSMPDYSVLPLKPSVVVPSATYIERGQRWMEKEDVVALRDALEDMDIHKEAREEARLHAAAQEEASVLVYEHQHPEAIRPSGPYRYKEHLRKNSYAHARTQSVGRFGTVETGLARDYAPRSVSGGSHSSTGMMSQRSRVSSGGSEARAIPQSDDKQPENRRSEEDTRELPSPRKIQKTYPGLTSTNISSNRRRSSGKRNISGEMTVPFSGEQIWEETEGHDLAQIQETNDTPAPLRLTARNPLNRVQFASELPARSNSTPPEPIKKLSRSEIHQNPPSQSRNPAYTANIQVSPASITKPDVPSKDGLEIRSEDIRQATSMKMKDRSPKLPTPTAVSDKPGRPIVSFDANWKPKEADLKPVEEPRRPRPEHRLFGSRESKSLPAQPVAKNPPQISVPSIQFPDVPSIQVNDVQPPVPTIFCSPVDIPTISISADTPTISVSTPNPIPSINLPEKNRSSGSTRPLPDPKTASRRPAPRHHGSSPLPTSRGHWSPAVGNRATATCHQCQLPIEGRVVALHGTSERFHPECFICHTCGTGLEALEISPEPPSKRLERLDRIHRRNQGEQLEEIEGLTMAEDGDERLRFYCHLDWHELFAPRCKHCKTPIIGEHAVALGEHWHYGHFFCAECGDPFEQGMTHIEKDGYAWCLSCQTKRTERQAPKCRACKKAVIGQYVQAMGGEYHDECFRCATCNGGFDDGQIFPRLEGGREVVLCTGCMERELKA